MKAKKKKQERSPRMQQRSAGLRDVLGMTQWRKEHPKATWAEIEAAVDEQINQLRARLLQEVVQMGLHRLKHHGPERVLKHLAWLAARYPSPLIQENLAYLRDP